jgi:asparagine synthase (glutamine-hydrolysing)
LGLVRPILPSKLRRHAAGDRLHRAAELISHAGHPAGVFDRLSSQWDHPSSIVIGSKEPATLLADPAAWPKLGDDLAHRLMYIDLVTYLPDDILVKVDRASMGVSLESRAPMLDHRVVEFAWRLPKSLKIRQGRGKWPLRQLLDRYVPRALTERPKMGFAVPVDSWLRGPLRDWASALLDENRLRGEGLFEPEAIRKRWEEHLSGRRNWKESLWTILMFQAWMERQK